MTDKQRSIDEEIAQIDAMLADPDAGFDALREDLPHLRSAADARRFLEGIREAYVDVREGRVVPHEQVVRDSEERRRRYRLKAA